MFESNEPASETTGEVILGTLADDGEASLSSLSCLALLGDLFNEEPSMLDSILLQACVNMANGLCFESKSS